MTQRDAVALDGCAPSCGGDQGRWKCLTCNEVFQNNMSATGHFDGPGNHVVCWYCLEHGHESP